MKDKIRGLGNGRVIIQRDFDRLETELEKARTQIAGLQKEKIGHDDEVVLARVRISVRNIKIVVQTSGSGNTFLLAVAFFFRQWEVPSGSENFLTSSGNAISSTTLLS
uniref:Uncharacterized protein n=1 Tax=Tanacetum cinerariifolium TaxID=118510 RepID=A0A6L2L6W0_TANCI|nr:hypothetical protein [Tanacetum cinerariifolium]